MLSSDLVCHLEEVASWIIIFFPLNYSRLIPINSTSTSPKSVMKTNPLFFQVFWIIAFFKLRASRRYLVDLIPNSWLRLSSYMSVCRLPNYSYIWFCRFSSCCIIIYLFASDDGLCLMFMLFKAEAFIWIWLSLITRWYLDGVLFSLSTTITFFSSPTAFDVLLLETYSNKKAFWTTKGVKINSIFKRSSFCKKVTLSCLVTIPYFVMSHYE